MRWISKNEYWLLTQKQTKQPKKDRIAITIMLLLYLLIPCKSDFNAITTQRHQQSHSQIYGYAWPPLRH